MRNYHFRDVRRGDAADGGAERGGRHRRLPDHGGEQLGAVDVDDGEGHADGEAADHREGCRHPGQGCMTNK